MDRRSALRLLAASGVGAAVGPTIVASSAFADGALSGCTEPAKQPTFFGGSLVVNGPFPNQAGTTPTVNVTDIAVFHTFGSYTCASGGVPSLSANVNYEWRLAAVGTPFLSTVVTPTGTPSTNPGWTRFTVNGVNIRVSGNTGTTYTLRMQVRATCCYGSCASWRCFQDDRSFVMGSGTFSSATDIVGSADCNTPGPVCP